MNRLYRRWLGKQPKEYQDAHTLVIRDIRRTAIGKAMDGIEAKIEHREDTRKAFFHFDEVSGAATY
jgi:hypothetical protein